jgi:hypothetical protein
MNQAKTGSQTQIDPSFTPYDLSQGATYLASAQLGNLNNQYQNFVSSMPEYQANLNAQATDQGNSQYNQAKDSIDRSANRRGLLYSGLKEGAEATAANAAATNTANQIVNNNANLTNYANQYGNQVANANIGNYNTQVQNSLAQYGQGIQQQGMQNQMLGGLLGGAGSIGALAFLASDEDLKENIDDGDDDAEEMLENLSAKKYNYKEDPKKQTHMGILAQDLEKSPMGKALVVETPKGKHVDIAKALGAVLAAQAVLHKRMNKKDAE